MQWFFIQFCDENVIKCEGSKTKSIQSTLVWFEPNVQTKKIQLNEKVQNVLEISLWIFILFFQQKWKSSASASDHKAKKSIIFITAASLHSMKNSTENSFNLFASIKYMHAELIKYKKLFKSEA